MESLSKILFLDHKKQETDFNKVKRDFELLEADIKRQTDITNISSNKPNSDLSSQDLEDKIFALQSLITRTQKSKDKICFSVEAHKPTMICNVDSNVMTRIGIYGFGSMASILRASSDFMDAGAKNVETPTWIKVYQCASEFLILPLIFTIEECLKRKEQLRAERIELKDDIEECSSSAQAFLEFLTHKKEVLGLQKGSQSPKSDEMLADLLEDVMYFRGMEAARAHEAALIDFARSRLESCEHSPRTRLKKAIERVEYSGGHSAVGSYANMGYQRSAFGQVRSRSFRSLRREFNTTLSRPLMYDSPNLATLGFSDLAHEVKQSHRGSSDENV